MLKLLITICLETITSNWVWMNSCNQYKPAHWQQTALALYMSQTNSQVICCTYKNYASILPAKQAVMYSIDRTHAKVY